MTKDERRAAMPETSRFIDDIRKHFGAESIVKIDAQEAGHVIHWIKQES